MSSSATLRREVQDYARGLIHLLGNHIGVITKAAEPKSRAIYQEATLVQHDPAKDANWQPDSPQRDERPAPPVGEDKLFDEWRETGYKKRLLIVAPAGSGKSCLLESFALRMAKDLVDPQRWPEAEPYPTAVPVLVPLQHVGQSPLRAYFRESERDQNSSLPVLRSETVDQLRAQNRLLLMLDGYDEVPASQNQLNREIALLPDRLVLTTRPGHGEIHLGDGQWKRQTLEELTQKHAETYVAAYFQAAAVSPRDVGTVKQLWSDAWTTPFGRLLRRPLYLKAWCKYVFERLQSRQAPYAPESLGDLARIQLEEAFHYRPEARTALEEAPRLTLDEFTRWFGNLGRVFAHGGFRDLKRDELAKQGVFAPDQDQAGRQRDERLERVAKSCGWLASSATTHRYRIPKTPLVEYLIGKSLALDVENDPESPQVLIETFRWWIWRRNLHDILDYTFDALWNTGQDQQRIWADQLLEWAFQVGIAVEHPVSEEQASLKEDICHPFVMSVVRWGQLNRRPQADQLGALERNTKQVVQAIRMAVLTSLDNEILAYGLVTDQIPIIPLIQGMIDAHQRAQEDPRAPFAWRDPIRSAAGQVRAEDAAGLVLALIDAHKRAERDQSTQSAWRDAIRSAAKQVRAEDAARLVKEWINAHHRAEGDQTTQSAWRDAIGSGAGQVRAEDVARLVKEWIDAHHRAEGDQTTQSAWRDAIWSAAGQVRAEDAAGLVLVLIDAHKRTEGDQTSRSAWRNAIGRAAGQVRSDDTARLVQEWIDAYQRADGDSDAQSAWRIAILSAAGQVRMEDPAGLVRKWFAAHQKAKGDPQAQSAWRVAVRSAAGQVHAEDAAGLVREWINAHQRAEGNPEAQFDWRVAIQSAAKQVRAEDAGGLVLGLIDAHQLAQGNWNAQFAWRNAIGRAAGQVRSDDASRLVQEWIDAYQRADGDSDAQSAWRIAILSAAGQVRMEDPAGLVRKWFDAHQKAKGDPEAQSDLCDAIRRAARQVRADAAAGLVREWIDAYQRADGDPDAQSAWRIAIEQAADRVRAEDAARLVQEWIDAHHRAEGDQTTQSAWRDAIWSAAGQVRAEDAAGLVRELIDAYQRAEAYSKAQFAWRFAIERAAGQVRDPNDGRESQSQPVIVETCQLLLTLGMLRAAYRIVRNHHGIALIWHRSGQQQEENDVEIQAVLRRDLILDPELLVPPPRIRAALIEAELSAMEASYAGGNPADQTQDVIERNTQALESLERQIGILGESTEWKSRSQQFKQRLNTLGNRLGFSEVSLQVSSNGDAHAEGKREAEASSRRINQAELDLLIRQHAIVLERLQMEINLDPEKETKNEALLRYFYEIGCQYKRPKSGESMGWVYTEIVARYANMRRNRTHVFHELSIKPATIFRLRKRIETHFCKLFDLPDDKTDRLFTRRAVQIGEKDTRDVTGLTPLGWFALKKTRRFLKTRRLIPRRIKKKS